MFNEYFKRYKKNNFYTQKLSSYISGTKVLNFLKHLSVANRILLIGDKDNDGMASVAMVQELISLIDKEKEVESYIPSRYDGYGMDFKTLEKQAIENKYDLVVTLDNGSQANFLQEMQESKIKDKFFIIDHHPDSTFEYLKIPNLINPNQDGSVSTSTGMVLNYIYMLAYDLHKKHPGKIFTTIEDKEIDLYYMSDIAMLTAISDMVNLDNQYTRNIVAQGINKACTEGKKLFARYRKNKNFIEYISFNIIPYINAIGRLAVSEDLNNIDFRTLYFTTKKSSKEQIKHFRKIWNTLETFNDTRKDLLKYFAHDAHKYLVDNGNGIAIYYKKDVPNNEKPLPGIAGLIAGKLSDDYNKPILAFAYNPTDAKTLYGSGRGTNLKLIIEQTLKEHPEFNISYGGHLDAFGIRVPVEQADAFIQAVTNKPISDKYLEERRTQKILPKDLGVEKAQVNFHQIVKSYEEENGGIPFGKTFVAPFDFKDFGVIQEYGKSGYAKVKLDKMECLCNYSNLKNMLKLKTQMPDNPVCAILPSSAKATSITFDIEQTKAELREYQQQNKQNQSVAQKSKQRSLNLC